MMKQVKNKSFSLTVLAGVIGQLLFSAQANAQAADTEASATEEKIVVVGRRVSQTDIAIGTDEATNTIAVTREELLSAPSGISGLKMLESLPGFNVQTDGALGLYEFGNSVQVRAFQLSQMGFVLDGIPMGRSDAFGGSPIFRYVDNENLGSVVASPGAGDVSAPSYSSLGPIASYNTVRPSEEMGGMVAVTVGDFDLQRTFVKLETGDIDGFRAYVSRSKTDSDLWRGPGTIDREHIEAKALYEFGDSYIQATMVSNDFFDYDSPSAPASTFASNYYYGYQASIPEGCVSADPGVYDFNGDGTIDDSDFTPVFTGSNCTSYYEDRINIRDDKLYSLGFGTYLSEDIQLTATAYFEDKDGYGVSPDSYTNSLGIYEDQAAAGLDVVHPRGVQYGLSTVGGEREGLVAGVSWFMGDHKVEFGGWVEQDTYNRTQARLNKTGGSADGDVIWDEVVYYRRDYTAVRDTTQLYLKDTISLLDDDLVLEVGMKSLSIDYSLDGYRDYNDYEIDGEEGYGPQHVEADYTNNFLPMVGAVYRLNDTDQLFASIAQNYALPAGTDDIFDNAIGFAAEAPKGEESDNIEFGYRTNSENYNGAVAVFYTRFDNRLIASSVLNPATGQPETFYVNAGASKAYGIEFSGVFQPEMFDRELYFNANVSYKKATLVDGFGSNPAGSQLPDSPEWLATGGVTYEPTEWLVANFSAKYTDTRYTDFNETYELKSYLVAQAYVDIGGPNSFGMPENMRLRFNVDNVFDKQVMSFGFTGSSFGRPLSPRTFQATLTVDF
ncbi:iron complex outermembrane recepter protein [Marisediminitalea aggregata]|uniref:Iron complex outermembrane recepter protein n=1 Tax=Marisediminitalea aggregata TaxID=634436 RepID=A0A1M5EA20_9ALTE|nr:TonB-dependent receptor [Marisediminitalea aggregata]SHF76089.1 iron complex outermembrane recepter protein [Marisediminitalea aggregata]